MGSIGKKIFMLSVGLLLAAGIPHLSTTPVHADPGCGKDCGHKVSCGCGHHGGCGCCEEGCGKGCAHRERCGQMADGGCEHGCPKDAGQTGAGHPCGMVDNTASGKGGMHGMMHGGKDAPPMKDRMAKHLEGMREKIGKLRAVEAKMEALKAKDDSAAYRAASLEHAKLLTDLQESHLKHMEGMMSGK